MITLARRRAACVCSLACQTVLVMMKRPRSEALHPIRLRELPLALPSLAKSVATKLEQAEAAVAHLTVPQNCTDDGIAKAKTAADVARESTFPFIERNETAYTAAYAAASLLWAASLVAEAQASDLDSSRKQEAATGALRALDLAMLRGGVDEWARHAEPWINAATALQAPQALLFPTTPTWTMRKTTSMRPTSLCAQSSIGL